MAITLNNTKNYIRHNMNVLVCGPAGTGKTAILRQACAELGLKVKYYQAATIDPFTDLVGIPVPQTDGSETVKYYRPHDVDEAEVIIIDEFNRADPRALNTFFEIIQFGTINGEPLPKLRCVLAAINPPNGDYTVDDLDLALVDRFDMYLEAVPEINLPYFRERFGREVAEATKLWWDEYHAAYLKAKKDTKNEAVYLSPRRMEKMVNAFMLMPNRSTLKDSAPMNGQFDLAKLSRMLMNAIKASEEKEGTAAPDMAEVTGDMSTLLNLDTNQLRNPENVELIKTVLTDSSVPSTSKSRLLTNLAGALNRGFSKESLLQNYGEALQMMSNKQRQILTAGWSVAKRQDIIRGLKEL